MKVYLVQHGEAKDQEIDPDRSLTDRGITDTGKVATFLAGQGKVRVSRVFHSGKTRARQTAEILAGRLIVAGGVVIGESLSPNDDVSIWAGRLTVSDEDLMLVGHLPHLSRLASTLLCGDPEKQVVSFRNSGVVCLARGEMRTWSVAWIVIPELIGKAS